MPKRSKAKRKAEARHRAQQPKPEVWPGDFHAKRIAAPLARTRGKPRAEGDIGGTRQTIAKLETDLLLDLTKAKILTPEEAAAGRTILDVWEIVTPPQLRAASSLPGRGVDPNNDGTARLERTWEVWANEMFARTHVRHTVVVEWLLPPGHEKARRCDMDPKGAAGVLRDALRWWLKAAQGVGVPDASNPRSVPRNRSKPLLPAQAQVA